MFNSVFVVGFVRNSLILVDFRLDSIVTRPKRTFIRVLLIAEGRAGTFRVVLLVGNIATILLLH